MLHEERVEARIDVPFIDLDRVNQPIKQRVLARIGDLIDRNEYGPGPTVTEFEARLAAYCGVAACAGVSSGLDALRLALAAAGLEPGDEVLVPANTFFATFEAISQLQAVPVPVDVSDADYNIDVTAAEAAITPATRVVVPVHLYGQLADLDGIDRLASKHGLGVVEDACQALGASRGGRYPGDRSAAAVFSFYPAKNLGAMGDAGAVVSQDPSLVAHIRVLREHGQTQKYVHGVEGWTARLDGFQAAVLLEKLDLLDGWNEERRSIASRYLDELEGAGDLGLPQMAPESRHVWHLFVVTTADPASFIGFLGDRRIGTGRHYPQPPHLSPAYRGLGFGPGAFPVTERLADSCVSLPIFPGMTEAQVDAVCVAVKDYFADG